MQKVHFHRISLTVTLRCTLSCKLCCAFVPYKQPQPHYSLEQLCKNVDTFFEIADSVDIFVLCGGEPLVHRNLAEVIDYIGNYRGKISERLELITNGTIVPSKKLLSVLRKWNVNVLIDDYGEHSSKANECYKLLNTNDIRTELRANNSAESHFDGWLSYDFNPQSTQITPHYKDPKKIFANCLSANELRCHPIIDNKIYVCTPQEHLEMLGVVPVNPKYYIDLSQNVSIEHVKNFLNLNYQTGCEFCSGWDKTGQRFVPAEQLS